MFIWYKYSRVNGFIRNNSDVICVTSKSLLFSIGTFVALTLKSKNKQNNTIHWHLNQCTKMKNAEKCFAVADIAFENAFWMRYHRENDGFASLKFYFLVFEFFLAKFSVTAKNQTKNPQSFCCEINVPSERPLTVVVVSSLVMMNFFFFWICCGGKITSSLSILLFHTQKKNGKIRAHNEHRPTDDACECLRFQQEGEKKSPTHIKNLCAFFNGFKM